jgi:hypothetical protein
MKSVYMFSHMLKKVSKGYRFRSDEDVKVAVVPAAAKEPVHGGSSLAGASVVSWAQHPWGLFLMVFTSPRTIPEWVSVCHLS